MAASTGNGRWPNQQCARHHRSDPETTAASQIVASRTGNGRMPAEPQAPRRNHQQQETPTFLPLPARQSAFLAYFLFGQKKVGRAGGAKAFDFDFDVKAFDFEVAFEAKQLKRPSTSQSQKKTEFSTNPPQAPNPYAAHPIICRCRYSPGATPVHFLNAR